MKPNSCLKIVLLVLIFHESLGDGGTVKLREGSLTALLQSLFCNAWSQPTPHTPHYVYCLNTEQLHTISTYHTFIVLLFYMHMVSNPFLDQGKNVYFYTVDTNIMNMDIYR